MPLLASLAFGIICVYGLMTLALFVNLYRAEIERRLYGLLYINLRVEQRSALDDLLVYKRYVFDGKTIERIRGEITLGHDNFRSDVIVPMIEYGRVVGVPEWRLQIAQF